MEKLITTALVSFFVVSATYIALFYNTNLMFVFTAVLRCNFLVLVFSSKFTCHGHATCRTYCRIAAAVTGFISTIMAVPISIYIGRFIASAALVCWFFNMR
jgi:DHA1 family bicyclomycin/chloramphenicol resistance-like MFS transporter